MQLWVLSPFRSDPLCLAPKLSGHHGKPQGSLHVVESTFGETFKPDGIDYGLAEFFDEFDCGVIAFQ